ncbi:MAG: ATP-dependent RNA helicase DeaD [Pelotomaculum sp. PtaB.Bin013]|uniref:DEAD/DEAH box helicase n=1 Tax=Pelotomaculum isophthalicicum JI TaxID=947010 RepID=A0A9X4JU25_9FIRM|nr:DEAD/DEAH box helicase [Pelotomaculum isophthalicicum]MDF9409729.1 DEAD/DEAH box helicase [Pelotomaculum isophthalicicum JI]OPX89018.1 MAG: ATP-dependent RNA helicase DeaD [Pelotomaculum sp. PtaB.Bin013]
MEKLLDRIKNHHAYKGQIVHIEGIEPQQARYSNLGFTLHPDIGAVLRRRGIEKLYTHQVDAIKKVRGGNSIVVVTPTASGKTMCYNLPVLDSILRMPQRTALYLFPTKSLGQDQLDSILDYEAKLNAGVYDGDTPDSERTALRDNANIIITNPDMLHWGILPNHLKWHRFFSNLKYVVIDEMHNYRGVFGTHVSHIIRRLRRICRHYGADPVFILCSATIANPREHASRLTGRPVELIDNNGAPRGRTKFVLWRPPIHTPYIREVSWLLSLCLENRYRTIAFSRARQVTERILRFTRNNFKEEQYAGKVMAYRGGYLADERRKIESALFNGSLLGVVSTNALELGIDVGDLEVCLIAGFPGTIASTWQQAGRVGRSNKESLVIFIAVETPLDQYFIRNTGALFAHPSEQALIDPDNPYILMGHALCATHEMPVTPEDFSLWSDTFVDLLTLMEEDSEVVHSGGTYFYNGQTYPAERVNVRSSSSSLFHLRDTGRGNRLLEVLDENAAMSEVYPGAVYTHQGSTYVVNNLDLNTGTAFMKQMDVDYYTMCGREKNTEILSTEAGKELNGHRLYSGQLKVTTRVTGFIKKHEKTGQVVGGDRLELPERVMETTGMWVVFNEIAAARAKEYGLQLMGGLHAVEHASIGLLPLFAMCDRNDLGGLSTVMHPQTQGPTIFIHDSCHGGVGFSEKGYDKVLELFEATLEAITSCQCEAGCPMCIYSPKCSNFNRPLDKEAAVYLLHSLLGKTYTPSCTPDVITKSKLEKPVRERLRKALRNNRQRI